MRIVFSKQFRKEIEKAKHTYLISKIKELIAIVKNNPFKTRHRMKSCAVTQMLIPDASTSSIDSCIL